MHGGQPVTNYQNILFHRNDPKDIYRDHGNPTVQSQRQPDIVVTSLQSAGRAGTPRENPGVTWNEICLKQAPKTPISRFQWYDVVASVEMESNRAPIPTTHIDNLATRGVMLDRRPHKTIDLIPKSNKRRMRSESTTPSVVERAVKRPKTESL